MRVLILGWNRLHRCSRYTTIACLGSPSHSLPPRHESSEADQVLCGDRNRLGDSMDAFRQLRPEVVIDAIAFTQPQAESLVEVFRGIAKRLVVLSSGDVYRANDILFARVLGAVETTPLTESSALRERLYPYRGRRIPGVYDFNWDDYDKILVERAVLNNSDLPATVLRL